VEFVAVGIWSISNGWKADKIVSLDEDWATQQVPFPRFNLRLKEGQSLDEFIDEVEKNVDALIGESTLNEYKAYKNLVKHKKRVNRVFSELGAETAHRSPRPGVDKKALAVAVASYSAAPPKAPRRKSAKKRKSSACDTSSSLVRPEKTKSLESSKRKRNASEGISDAEIQAASGLAQLGQKKAKKAVKNVVVSTVQRIPSAFSDDETTDDLRPTGFSSCLWCDLRFNVRRSCTPGFENKFVDVETFQMTLPKFRRTSLILLMTLLLRVHPPKSLPLKIELLPNLLMTWRGPCKGVVILLKTYLWSRHAKSFPKGKTPLLRLLPSMNVSVRPLGENY
jgi:uncharacterized protein YktA (UPF0223 family)